MPASDDAYTRAFESGRIAARLDGHDAQLHELSSTLSKVVDIEGQLTLTVQALGRDAKARDEKAVALALALKEAEDERRTQSETIWSPFAKIITVIVAVAAVLSVTLAYLSR